MNSPRSALVVFVFLSSAAAQTFAVTPAVFANKDAPGRGQIAGFDARMRQQLVVDGNVIKRNSKITAIWVRRDRSFGEALVGGQANIRVDVSSTSATPQSPSRFFAANRGRATTVFRGTISLPATGRVGASIPWDAKHAVRIPFATVIAHSSRNLCVEIEGEPISPPAGYYWIVDYAVGVRSGSVTEFGRACGPVTSVFRDSALASGRNLAVGGTFGVTGFGRQGTSAFLLLGARFRAGIDMGTFGAPGCTLYIDPKITIPGAHHAGAVGEFTNATYRLHLPRDPNLLSRHLFLQIASLDARTNRLGLAMTNALDLQVGPTLPTGTLSTVMSDELAPRQAYPEMGIVEIGRGPVLRIEHR